MSRQFQSLGPGTELPVSNDSTVVRQQPLYLWLCSIGQQAVDRPYVHGCILDALLLLDVLQSGLTLQGHHALDVHVFVEDRILTLQL